MPGAISKSYGRASGDTRLADGMTRNVHPAPRKIVDTLLRPYGNVSDKGFPPGELAKTRMKIESVEMTNHEPW